MGPPSLQISFIQKAEFLFLCIRFRFYLKYFRLSVGLGGVLGGFINHNEFMKLFFSLSIIFSYYTDFGTYFSVLVFMYGGFFSASIIVLQSGQRGSL